MFLGQVSRHPPLLTNYDSGSEDEKEITKSRISTNTYQLKQMYITMTQGLQGLESLVCSRGQKD